MVNLDKYSSIFIANWKLNGNSSFLKDYYEKLKVNSNNCTIICAPAIYLKSLKKNRLAAKRIARPIPIHDFLKALIKFLLLL